MLPLCLVWLLFFSPGVLSSHYKFDGHWTGVTAEHVEGKEHKRGFFLNFEEEIQKQLNHVLSEKVEEFFITHFELHGPRKTPIFEGYLTVDVPRQSILSLIEKAPTLSILHLAEIDKLPEPPSILATGYDAAVESCTNGGILLPNSTCACTPYTSGDRCETVNCLHQGFLDYKSQLCSCPPGVYAVNCEPRACLPPVQESLDISARSFVLVLNTKSSMAFVTNYLLVNLQTLLNDVRAANNIKSYVAVSYISTANIDYIKPKAFTSATAMVDYLLQNVAVSDGTPEQKTNYAILRAQTYANEDAQIAPFSNIFVFTDSVDEDGVLADYTISSNSTENMLIMQTIAWRHRILYLLSQPKGVPLDDSDDFYGTYRRVAQATLGDIVSFDSLEVSQIMRPLMLTYQFIEFIEARYGSNASQTVSLFQDFPNQTIYALVTVDPSGTLPAVTVQNGQPLKVEGSGARFMLLSTTKQTKLKITPSGSTWSVKAFVASTSTALIAYGLDDAIDIGDAYTSAEVPNIATLAPIGLTGPVLLYWKNIKTGVTTATVGSPKQRTEECTFPLATSLIKSLCTPGPFVQYLMLKSGQNNVVRLVPGFCGVLDHVPPAPFQCFNGGNLTSSKSCDCPVNFSGADCATPLCLNGGSPDNFPGNGRGLCNCRTGYGGDHCEILSCLYPSEDIFYNVKRTFGLVLQSSYSQAQLSPFIQQGLAIMLNQLAEDGDPMSEYVLTSFVTRNGQNLSDITSNAYNSVMQFTTAVHGTKYVPSPNLIPQDSLNALWSAMNKTTYPRSSFFLFVDAAPSATADEMDIIYYAIQRQFDISIIITPPFNMYDLCLNDVSVYNKIAEMTGGVLYNLCQSYGTYQGDPIIDFFETFGSSHHNTENVAEEASPSCRAATDLDFFVDDPSAEHFLIVNSDATENFTATMINKYDPTQSITLTPISTTPFIAVYNLSLASQNTKGYSIRVTDGPGTQYGRCYSRVAEKTWVAVYMGFSYNPSQDANSKTLTFATKNHPVVHMGTPMDNSVKIEAIDDLGNDFYEATDIKRNASCRYESYFAEPFICDSLYGTFVLKVITTTPAGAVIQRSRRAICWLNDNQCLNGGSYVNGACLCRPGEYMGKYCEYPICQNGAELRDFHCICGETRTGPLCQYETCPYYNYMETANPREWNFQQITFVLNINIDQALVNSYLNGIIQMFVYSTETSVPRQYSLVTFDETTVTTVASTTSQDDFFSLFQKAASRITPTTGKPTMAIDAVLEAYKINIEPPAIIYLFTGSSISKPAGFDGILRERLGTQVNVIYTPANTAYPTPPGGYGIYLSIAARQSGGRMLPLTQNSIQHIAPYLISTVEGNALVFDDAAKDCSQGANFTFVLEPQFTTVYIDVLGVDVNLPNRVHFSSDVYGSIAITPKMILFNDNSAVMYAINHQPFTYTGGQWTVSIRTTSGSCFAQVRTRSLVRLVPGFTSDENADFVKGMPFTQYGTNKTSYMTYRLVDRIVGDNEMEDTISTLSRVDISQGDFDKPWSGRKDLQNLKIIPRDSTGCASQYVSQQWKLNSAVCQKFVVYGSDKSNHTFQRTLFYSFNKPSSADLAATCQFGSRNSNGECVCDGTHTGDFCTDRLCLNGGSQSFGICVCPNGYYGDFCEKLVFNPPAATTMSSGTQGTSLSVSTIAPTTTTSGTVTTTPANQQSPSSTAGVTIEAQTPVTTTSTAPGTTTFQTTTMQSTVSSTAITSSQFTSTGAASTTTSTSLGSSSILTTLGFTTQAAPSTTSGGSSSVITTPTTIGATTTNSPSTMLPSTEGTTQEPTTAGSTATTILRCDPYTTTYMVSAFLDATDLFDDPHMGTLFSGENTIVQLLAQQLYLGTGMSSTRFVLSGIASTYQTVGNVTSQDIIQAELPNLAPKGADLAYNLTNALIEFQAGGLWKFGNNENPPIAIFFSATPLADDLISAQVQIDAMSARGYKMLGVNVGFNDQVQSELSSLLGSDNVYESIAADQAATWLRNKICKLKPF